MEKHSHHHSGSEANREEKREKRRRRQLHKDWRTWLVIAVMLAAIGIYVLTLDDSIQPVPQSGAAATTPSKP